MKKYFVSGKGIYQFDLLPQHLRVYHSSLKEATDFIENVAKECDQSILYFHVFESEVL